MQIMKFLIVFAHLFIITNAVKCQNCSKNNFKETVLSFEKKTVKPGAYDINEYLHLLKNKKVAFVGNHTSVIDNTHTIDTLLSLGVNITKAFSPEHGFRGNAADGELISNEIDKKTGIPIISLYGKNRKPTANQLSGIDYVIFDIQDVGVRFYTYISTMSLVMEACAESKIPIIVLDRPNPNAFYIDGPILDEKFSSFVGMHKVPIVYGMTIGEYALMVNGEKWLANSIQCDLKVVKCMNYTHDSIYKLPVKPSPNLPTMEAILLYPSLCLFEGTVVSVGRGTNTPFEIIGHPDYKKGNFKFTPKPIKGVSEKPPLEGKLCNGLRLTDSVQNILEDKKLNLSWLIDLYKSVNQNDKFFTSYFNKLAGNDILKNQIQNNVSERTIRESWKADLDKFKQIRKKYLIYPDFN